MRKPEAALVAVKKPSVPAASRGDSPVELVCMALALALAVLALRIASIW
jgi:hypothetical protein